MADHWEYLQARRAPEERSAEEALLAERASTKKFLKKQYLNELKVNHFISQSGQALTVPGTDQPVLSIIVTPAGRSAMSLVCLETLLARTSLPFELTIFKVSDEENQETHWLKKIKGATILEWDDRAGFGDNANRAARPARGEFLVFLSGAALVPPGWAGRLVADAAGSPARAAVGARLVLPDGTLLEAGNLLGVDGTVHRYGRGDNPFKPEYAYARQVACASPACLLVRRDLFQSIGGFAAVFRSPLFAAADLGQRLLRDAGQPTFFSPVTVYLQEGPVGESAPVLEADRSQFLDRRRTALPGESAGTLPLSRTRDLRPGKRLLFIEDRIPAPPQGCGFPRSFTILRTLAELGYIITVLPTQSPTPWQPFTAELERLGVETLYGRTGPWRSFFRERAKGYELVWISRHHNLPAFLPLVRTFLPEAAVIFDSEALFSLRELERVKLTAPRHQAIREIQFQKRLQEEFRLMKEVDLVVTVSEKERGLLEAAGIGPTCIWPHAVAPQPPNTPFRERRDLLFVGGFTARESPNTAAVLYFLDRIFPRLEQRLGCRLWIVGSHPPPEVRERAGGPVEVTGYQESLDPFYERCRLFVVPHRYAGGIPLKLLEAMGRGLPAVVSPVVAEQAGLRPGREVLIAGNPEEFVEAAVRAYGDEGLWSALQAGALAYIEAHCSPAALKSRLWSIVDQAESLRKNPRAGAVRPVSDPGRLQRP